VKSQRLFIILAACIAATAFAKILYKHNSEIEANSSYPEKHIVLVVASYKNAQWYKWNLDSAFNQNYKNYHIIYIDDCSPDGTYDLVKAYVQEKRQEDRITLIKNDVRAGCPLANHYKAIQSCKDTDIIIILDGDDALAGPDVLPYINAVYSDPNVWLTYGQYQEWPNGARGFCSPYPAHIVANNAFREWADTPSHLRTFYAGLFKQIKTEDLICDGQFFIMTGDMAAMIPMIEMARDHFKFIPKVLYLYNATNVLSEHRVDKALQRKLDLEIRSRKRYDKIESPFRNAKILI
jgi:glycosyltransferase involved in cell wall biosynthesis